MATILGVSGTYHDAAAALIVDGKIMAALQEERLSRVKNDPSLPFRAIEAVLSISGRPEIDQLVYYENPYAKLERVLRHHLAHFPRSLRVFPRAIASQLGGKLQVLDTLSSRLSLPRSRVRFVSHHHSHAASALFTSPWHEAAVLTIDGVGESTTTGMWDVVGGRLRCMETTRFPHSIGLLYAAITSWLGFSVNEGEGKTMALAAYGRPNRREVFGKFCRLTDGGVSLTPSFFDDFLSPTHGFGPKLEQVLGSARPPGKPWDLSTAEDLAYADVAATVQQLTEEATLHLARRARRMAGTDKLCLAGGVALNAVVNRRLSLEGPLYVQPAAGDAGGALGAALIGALDAGDTLEKRSLRALGLPCRPERASQVARELGLTVATCDSVASAARDLEAGKIIAWCHGRHEWGPRALGQRSLLASPLPLQSRERLNREIKRREPFRPFAPAISAEGFSTYFEGVPDPLTAYMTTTRDVLRPEMFQAITHVDGSARVQSVHDGPLSQLLPHLDHSCVLNTSLNGPGEPIAATDIDAISFFLRHSVDALYIEDLRITR